MTPRSCLEAATAKAQALSLSGVPLIFANMRHRRVNEGLAAEIERPVETVMLVPLTEG